MINTAGAYILILIWSAHYKGGIAVHEVSSFEACQAAIVQLEPMRQITGYCIAKEVLE